MILSIRTALAATFLLATSIPLGVFWFWPHSAAMQNKVAEVQERHLLIAKNLGAALERYYSDIFAAFETFAPIIAQGRGDEARSVLKNLHFRHVCVADAETGKVTRELLNEIAPCPETIPSDRFAMFLELSKSGPVAMSDVMTPSGDVPRLFVVARSGGSLVVGAIGTTYFQEVQKRISFGRQGHAAIFDRSGRVLAHPLEDWSSSARDLSQVSAVQRMMAGETGVETFYSPALKGEMIAGFTSVKGPGWGVMVPQPLTELREVAERITRDAFVIFAASLLLSMATAWYLASQIARRIGQVEAATARMACGEEHVRVDGSRYFVRVREISNLRDSFNRMSEQLYSAKTALIDESYKSGHADMAASTLHNLRNAMNPLINRVSDAKSILSDRPGVHMAVALKEIADPETDEKRRRQLLEYCALCGSEQEKWLEKLQDALKVTTRQFARIKEILVAEEQLSHEPPVISDVELRVVVEEALNLVPIDEHEDIAIEIDGSVNETGMIRTSRLLLLQVIQNLLANAIESVSATETRPKRIVIKSREELVDDVDMVRITVHDSGLGIESSELEAIFNAGYSRKHLGRGGLGLHWCANTITRLHGRIFAASDGIGRGANINILLPRAA